MISSSSELFELLVLILECLHILSVSVALALLLLLEPLVE